MVVAVFIVAFLAQSVVLLSRSSPSYQISGVNIRPVDFGSTATACAPAGCVPPVLSAGAGGDVATFEVRGQGTTRVPTCTVKATYRGRRYGPVGAALSASPGAPSGSWSGLAVLGPRGGGLTTRDTQVHCH